MQSDEFQFSAFEDLKNLRENVRGAVAIGVVDDNSSVGNPFVRGFQNC